MRKIDLLKVSDSRQSSDVEARLEGLEGKGGVCSEKVFPKDFAAYGCNGTIQFADARIKSER